MKLLNVYFASGKLENGNTWENIYLQCADVNERHSDNFNEVFPNKYRIVDLKISRRNWDLISKDDPTLLINKDITVLYDSNKKPVALQVK